MQNGGISRKADISVQGGSTPFCVQIESRLKGLIQFTWQAKVHAEMLGSSYMIGIMQRLVRQGSHSVCKCGNLDGCN